MYTIYTNNFLPGWMLGVKCEADLPDGVKDQGWAIALRATHDDVAHLCQGISAFRIDGDRFYLFKIFDNEIVFQSTVGGSISAAAMLCDFERLHSCDAEFRPRSRLLDRGDWMKMGRVSL